MNDCASLDEVRQNIDAIDRQIVALLAQRGKLVVEAARFKRTIKDVKAPARVAQVLEKVRNLARETGAPEDLVVRVYETMIKGFIDLELSAHNKPLKPE